MFRMIDVHSHIAANYFDGDRDVILADMQQQGIATITIGVDFKSSEQAVRCSNQYENVYASVGLHPLDNPNESFVEDTFRELVKHSKVVAIGECGIDLYRLEGTNERLVERQREQFYRQIIFAREHNLPLMIHGRPRKGSMDAYEVILEMLKAAQLEPGGADVRGNVHFFVGSIDIARRFLDLGFALSLSGVVTFASEYDEVARFIPGNMIFAETDSPYATPLPHRGKRNDPRNVAVIIEHLALLRGEKVEELRAQTVENVRRVFGI